jgi:transcriptional regulator with XRE-family HTH domain
MQKTLYTREYQQLLKLLRTKRALAKISQAELAERLDWTQAEVSKCETGVRRLDVVELKLWVEALGEDLLGFVADLYGSEA